VLPFRKRLPTGTNYSGKRLSKRPAASTTAALEEKLDGIVQLLQQRATQSKPAVSENGSSIGHSQEFLQSSVQETLTPATTCNSTTCTSTTTATTWFDSASIHLPPNIIDYAVETEVECMEYLETYRWKMVPRLPIVPIRPEITVDEMREQRPFLWLVIQAICSKNAARQKALGIEIKKQLGKEIILEGGRSMDLLLGILVYSAWVHYYIKSGPIVSQALLLGISLAGDLGLTRSVPCEPLTLMMNITASGCPKPPVNLSRPRTMEERRAVISLFLLTSM
jgi:hypothetical protein